jgi:hypothetical protein
MVARTQHVRRYNPSGGETAWTQAATRLNLP